jgi:hypothetical protein
LVHYNFLSIKNNKLYPGGLDLTNHKLQHPQSEMKPLDHVAKYELNY